MSSETTESSTPAAPAEATAQAMQAQPSPETSEAATRAAELRSAAAEAEAAAEKLADAAQAMEEADSATKSLLNGVLWGLGCLTAVWALGKLAQYVEKRQASTLERGTEDAQCEEPLPSTAERLRERMRRVEAPAPEPAAP